MSLLLVFAFIQALPDLTDEENRNLLAAVEADFPEPKAKAAEPGTASRLQPQSRYRALVGGGWWPTSVGCATDKDSPRDLLIWRPIHASRGN